MFDDMYTRLIGIVNYKILLALPIAFSLLMIPLVYTQGIPMGIDFQGGTWIEIITERGTSSEEIDELKLDLSPLNLEDLRVYPGRDVITGKGKLTIITTSRINETEIKPILEAHVGRLNEIDTAIVPLKERPPIDLEETLSSRFNADVKFDENTKLLIISAFEIDGKKLESALRFYLNQNITMDLQKKNINIKPVGKTLGKTFREQGIKAAIFAYLLIISVIFFAFRDPIPSLGVILAGTCDALIALGGMSIFGILLEPASLAALLMLIGYSVDSDILLTTRVLRRRTGTVDDRINDAMKTGLTMTGTTIVVMIVIILVSTTVFQIEILASIASVLLIGLLGDLTTTWFMNAGILKWYIEEKRGKLRILQSLGRR
ncbi:MAG: protein translocase subunit SecF [Candidatus Altiarchaeales archaeon]|nr:MAG: protein translocase subunit SecF [Candidatus Altiarchaeales archaeon]